MSVYRRSDDALAEGLDRWAREREGSALGEWTRASVGYSNETIIAALADGRRLVLRLPPTVGIFPTHDLAMEATVMAAVHAAGVGVPHPCRVEHDPSYVGAAFLAMPFVEGHIPNEVALADPWIGALGPAARNALHRGFVGALAAIHRVPGAGALALRGAGPDLGAELDHWQRYLDWVFDGTPLPLLRDGLAWCRDHRPEQVSAPGLLWGDVRTGNVVFADDGAVRAVLDWEMASFGPPELDVGWYLALERLIAHFTGATVEGFCDHDGVVTAYCEAGGAELRDLAWFETFALVRSTAIHSRTMLLAAREQGGDPAAVATNPVLGILAAAIGS